MDDYGKRRRAWPPSCTVSVDCDDRSPDMCPRPECDLVDRFWTFAKLCRCGNPADLLRLVRDGLDVLAGEGYHGVWVDANLALAYMLDAWELTEHGSSVYGSWLTDDGRALRDALGRVDFDTVLDADHVCER